MNKLLSALHSFYMILNGGAGVGKIYFSEIHNGILNFLISH